MNKHRFSSIVIVNYNHGKFLQQAIDSVFYQHYKNFELLVIDAKSTDDSVEIIKRNESKINWWVSEPDSGQSEAFNKGFSKAKGKFCFWINADDILLPNSLIKAKKIIDKNPKIQWFTANTIFFDVKGYITKFANGPNWINFLFKKTSIPVYGPTSIFSKRIFDEVDGFDETLHYSMDTDLWYRFLSLGYKFKRIHSYFWGFRIHKDSKTSHTFSEEPSLKIVNERNKIKKKNNIYHLKSFSILLKAIKFLNGNYMKSYSDTKKYKGKSITQLSL